MAMSQHRGPWIKRAAYSLIPLTIVMQLSSFASSAGLAALIPFALSMPLTGCKDSTSATTGDISKVGHVIVIYMENHSFDNLYGEFPGANGIANATASQFTQIDTATGKPFPTLPWNDASFSPQPQLANSFFNIDALKANSQKTEDLVHRYYHEQVQIDGGKMDKFAVYSTAKGLSMGYYHTAQLPMYPVVQQYTLCDNFFHSAFGGSFLNHIYMIAAAPPTFQGAPSGLVAKGIQSNGSIIDGAVSPDGYGINTLQTVNKPHYATPAANLCPEQTIPTIGDRMDAKGVSWAWYAGGWNAMLAGTGDSSLFQFHHQPFNYFAKYGSDTSSLKKSRLKDETDFTAALASGNLPAVSFVKPFGINNEHPGYADVQTGEMHLVGLINQIKASPVWNDCVVIITYDEHGGFWDHVPPPVIDVWGPGLRVPGIIISPFAKKGYIDHTQYETVSILSFIEKRWSLAPLGTRDAKADPFSNALQF